jgi:hypothetical protein
MCLVASRCVPAAGKSGRDRKFPRSISARALSVAASFGPFGSRESARSTSTITRNQMLSGGLGCKRFRKHCRCKRSSVGIGRIKAPRRHRA